MKNSKAVQNYNLTMRINKDNSQANGQDENMIEVLCLDETYLPARGLELLFRVTGNAQITGTIGNVYRDFTDGNGIARLKITDTTIEEVDIHVSVISNPDNTVEGSVNFLEAMGKLKITEVVNTNHSFYNVGEPSIAWPGASFMIRVTGGSGDVRWTVTQSSAEVGVDGSPTGDAVVVIRNKPRQICEITGTDEITNETVTFSFRILNFVSVDKKKLLIGTAKSIYGRNLLSPEECSDLYDQWGNLGKYAVWDISDDYWTNDIGLFSAKAFNFQTGIKKDVSTIGFPKKFTPYKVG